MQLELLCGMVMISLVESESLGLQIIIEMNRICTCLHASYGYQQNNYE